jgi:hypothetical protein
MELCRRVGWIPERTEHWNPFSHTKHDLYGFIDVLAMTDTGFIGIQATSKSNISARETKIRKECTVNAKRFLESGGRIEVWGWYKSKNRWVVKVRPIESI